jgi:hypothetical protein
MKTYTTYVNVNLPRTQLLRSGHVAETTSPALPPASLETTNKKKPSNPWLSPTLAVGGLGVLSFLGIKLHQLSKARFESYVSQYNWPKLVKLEADLAQGLETGSKSQLEGADHLSSNAFGEVKNWWDKTYAKGLGAIAGHGWMNNHPVAPREAKEVLEEFIEYNMWNEAPPRDFYRKLESLPKDSAEYKARKQALDLWEERIEMMGNPVKMKKGEAYDTSRFINPLAKALYHTIQHGEVMHQNATHITFFPPVTGRLLAILKERSPDVHATLLPKITKQLGVSTATPPLQ